MEPAWTRKGWDTKTAGKIKGYIVKSGKGKGFRDSGKRERKLRQRRKGKDTAKQG